MRKIVRTTALVAVLATALSATTVSAADTRSRTQRRERGSVAEMVRNVMKRFFGVSSLSDVISIPTPNDGSYNKNTGTTTGQE
jgi:hypothetical protein